MARIVIRAAGAHPDEVRSKSDIVELNARGWMAIAGACLSAFGVGVYVVMSVGWKWYLPLLVAAWAMLILVIEVLFQTVVRPAGKKRQIGPAVLRLLLAGALAFITSSAVVMALNYREVDFQLKTDQASKVSTYMAPILAQGTKNKSSLEAQIKANDAQVAAANQTVQNDLNNLACEAGGTCGSMIKGDHGPVATAREGQYESDKAAASSLQSQMGANNDTIDKEIAAIPVQEASEKAAEQALAASDDGPFAHEQAFEEVVAHHPYLNVTRWMILAVLMMIECLAIFRKSFGPLTQYEYGLQIETIRQEAKVKRELHNAADPSWDDVEKEKLSILQGVELYRTQQWAAQARNAIDAEVQPGEVAERPSGYQGNGARRPGARGNLKVVGAVSAATAILLAALAFALVPRSSGSPSESSIALVSANGPSMIDLPGGGTLRVPYGAITPGAKVTAFQITSKTRPSSDDVSLPAPTAAGHGLTAVTGSPALMAAGVPIKLDVTGGKVLSTMEMTFPISSVPPGYTPEIATYVPSLQSWQTVASSYNSGTKEVSASVDHFSSWVQVLATKAISAAGQKVENYVMQGISNRLSEWLTQPGCASPNFSISASDFTSEKSALEAGAKLVWAAVSAKCTASSPGLPNFLYSIPLGTIVRDPGTGNAFLVTDQGYKSIPTGGDYECFVAQGDPVLNFPGLMAVTFGFNAGNATCTPPTSSKSASPQLPSASSGSSTQAPQSTPSTPPTSTSTTTSPSGSTAPAPATPTTTTTTTLPPETTTTTTTTTTPPTTQGFVIEDSYYGGTWARTDPDNGTWYPHDSPPPNGAYWYPNGLSVAVNCTEQGASYVAIVNGQQQTWSWWAHVTDGKWVPVVVFSTVWSDGSQGLPSC
jgi:hypothetical protein